MIQAINVTKELSDGRKLLNDISFKVEKGEFVGILGASGAGKSLTMRCLNGLMKPSSGKVLIECGDGCERDIAAIKGKELRNIRQKIGVVFQGFCLVKRLTALDNVLIGRLGQMNTVRSLLYGFNDKEAREAMEALEKVKIGHKAFSKVATLSGGEAQRVSIARAIYQNPRVLLADEPVSSLDPSNASKIMKLIRPLAEQMPVIGVFHQPELTSRYCTRVIAIKNGEKVYDGAPNLSHKDLEFIYGEELEQLIPQYQEEPKKDLVSA